jgi:hypothetical protein
MQSSMKKKAKQRDLEPALRSTKPKAHSPLRHLELLAASFWRSNALPYALIVLALGFLVSGLYLVLSIRRTATVPEALPVSLTRPEVDAAIKRGTEAYVRDYVRPSYNAVSNGGYVEYTNSLGETHRYGPRTYIASQIYLLVHYMMYAQKLGISADDPLLKSIQKWFVEEFDARQGRWIWSEEGCLQAKGMLVLAQLGHRELAEKAWLWAKASPLWLPESSLFTMMSCGNIITTVGDARLSLTGRHGWEHGAPIPDMENSAKFLYALLACGHKLSEPETARLYGAIERYVLSHPLVYGETTLTDVLGLVWFVLAHHDFGLEGGRGYAYAIQALKEGIGQAGLLRGFEMSRRFLGVRGSVLEAVLAVGKANRAVEEEVAFIISKQGASGAWLAANSDWWLERKPAIGIRMGQMDGANTYMATLGLIAYRNEAFRTIRRQATAMKRSGAAGTFGRFDKKAL